MKLLLVLPALSLAALFVAADDVPQLVKQLKSGDVDARRSAAKGLGELGSGAKEAVPALIEALKDNDRFVRRFAAQALGEVGPAARSAVPTLNGLLRKGEEKKEVLDAVTAALGKIGGGPSSAKMLAMTLLDKGSDTEVRRQAAEALGKMGSGAKTAIPALVEVLKPAKGPPPPGELRTEAATALGEIATPADKAAVDALTTLSTDKGLRRDGVLMKAINDALKKIKAKTT